MSRTIIFEHNVCNFNGLKFVPDYLFSGQIKNLQTTKSRNIEHNIKREHGSILIKSWKKRMDFSMKMSLLSFNDHVTVHWD